MGLWRSDSWQCCRILRLAGGAPRGGRTLRRHFLYCGRRRNEIGIRMALGASRGDVVGIIVRQTRCCSFLASAPALSCSCRARGAVRCFFLISRNDVFTFAVGNRACLVSIHGRQPFIPARRLPASIRGCVEIRMMQ